MNITAVIEAISDETGAGDRGFDELTAEGEPYEAAVAALRERVPAGWRIMDLRRTEY